MGNHFSNDELNQRFKQVLEAVSRRPGGECLSVCYEPVMEFRCNLHSKTWKTSYRRIVTQNRWCSKCAYQKNSIEMLHNSHINLDVLAGIAKERRGSLLDTQYLGVIHKYTWKCELGHTWKCSASNILNNFSWCPICNSSISENMCREVLEKLTGKKFPTCKPPWLCNPNTGGRMHLDGFCEELNLAFEYQGIQHSQAVEYFGGTSQLENLQKRDTLKHALCQERGIRLLVIPTLKSTLSIKELQKHITSKLDALGIKYLTEDITLTECYRPYCLSKLEELQRLAISRQGKLLSNAYLGKSNKLLWECGKFHTFEMAPHNVKSQWCPQCAGVAKKNIQWLHELAATKNGTCLATHYSNNRTPVLWKCENPLHRPWLAPAYRIASGHWCPQHRNELTGLRFRKTQTPIQPQEKPNELR